MPPVLLSGRSPSVTFPLGSFGWICVGRLLLLVSPAPLLLLETMTSPWRLAPLLGCLVPRPLVKTAVRFWRRASGCLPRGHLMPLKALAASRRRPPLGCLALGLLGPWNALASLWWRVPVGCLMQGRLEPSKAAVAAS